MSIREDCYIILTESILQLDNDLVHYTVELQSTTKCGLGQQHSLTHDQVLHFVIDKFYIVIQVDWKIIVLEYNMTTLIHLDSARKNKKAYKNAQISSKSSKTGMHNVISSWTNFGKKYSFLCSYWLCLVRKVLW